MFDTGAIRSPRLATSAAGVKNAKNGNDDVFAEQRGYDALTAEFSMFTSVHYVRDTVYDRSLANFILLANKITIFITRTFI